MTVSNQSQETALGVNFSKSGTTFSAYSASATSMQLCILDDENPRVTKTSIELIRGENDIWSANAPDLIPGTKYCLRADGPKGLRDGFNKTLQLIDPYAKAVSRDSAREYHCVAIDGSFDWQGVVKPNIPLAEAVLYEAHARGLTRGNETLPDELRGTYAALGHESTIAHLKKIGITSVELLPIQMFISEPRLMNMGLFNYWGYNTINFFSPHPRYATASAREAGPLAIVNELKTAIRELHRAGIEVILDVVYNHTAEGGSGGLTYSYRGLDNSSYYRQDDLGNYYDTTGCGNSLDFSNRHVVQMVLDSLRYWVTEMQIDGFRFDLATTLARNELNHYNPGHPLLRAINDDPVFDQTKMIVEPWDVGLGGWQTGNFPDRFSEWNDRFRDSIRKFWLTDVALAKDSGKYWNGVAEFATRIAGSQDVFDGPNGPLGSVNFITAHDGFTLKDLVSYNVKHNQVNGESNRDGSSNNYSYNHGSEGEASDTSIHRRRQRSMRNLLATLLFSSGVPMVTAGDERAKTQLGNNNAYCQDSKMTWVNWDLTKSQQEIEDTFAYLTKLRRENPALRPSKFGNYEKLSVDADRVRWFKLSGQPVAEDDWHNAEKRGLQRLSEHLDADGKLNRLLLVVNGTISEIDAILPSVDDMVEFEILWDSYHDDPPSELESILAGAELTLGSTSMQLLRVKEPK